jgi:hypothetical protein
VAGSGEKGFSDGPARACKFCYPHDVEFHAQEGVLLVADFDNNCIRRVFMDLGVGSVRALSCRCPVAALSLPCRCPVAALSLPCRCPVAALSLPCRCPVAALSLPCVRALCCRSHVCIHVHPCASMCIHACVLRPCRGQVCAWGQPGAMLSGGMVCGGMVYLRAMLHVVPTRRSEHGGVYAGCREQVTSVCRVQGAGDNVGGEQPGQSRLGRWSCQASSLQSPRRPRLAGQRREGRRLCGRHLQPRHSSHNACRRPMGRRV